MKLLQANNLILILGVLISSGCGATPPPASTANSVPETFTPRPPTPAALPTDTPASLNINPQVIVLAENLSEPDDLVLAPDGSIYISDVTDGTLEQYTPSGQLITVLAGLSAPEGMAFLPDGSMIIAEQGKNRLLHYNLDSRTLAPFLDLVNRTGNLGVDGILWDGTNLIVPDSPHGTVLQVSPDGKTVQRIASGLVRPTGVWRESTGDLLIADESGNAVFRLRQDGPLEKLADFSTPDDVIEDGNGNIFVATLGDNAIHVLTANQDLVLVSGLKSPQGLIFDAGGNLIVTDSGNHRLLKVLIH